MTVSSLYTGVLAAAVTGPNCLQARRKHRSTTMIETTPSSVNFYWTHMNHMQKKRVVNYNPAEHGYNCSEKGMRIIEVVSDPISFPISNEFN
jgi:hypothetical protein